MAESLRAPTDAPVIALAMGDPAGISPELTARMLADPAVLQAAGLIVIGDRRVLDEGARIAGVAPQIETIAPDAPLPQDLSRPVFIDLGTLDPASIPRGQISEPGGRFAAENFRYALSLAMQGHADAVSFTPFNKAAMRLHVPGYDDEISFTANFIGFKGAAKEFNVLPGLWNARVTSHVPLSGVAPLITFDAILGNLELTSQSLRDSGLETPRIAVAALNPHAGDGGNFGREEIDVIGPAVEEAKRRGIVCDGPFPSDTVFVRARRGDFDAVLTMFHDQGQIAMKLIGFEEGVTLMGGFPVPICTPAHGTAYDIAGQGKAHPGATRNALLLAARMGSAQRRRRPAPQGTLLSVRAAMAS
ncbi:4-hydroxythreonine-4-phosphate dehydrogenase [Pseudoroseomonas deserti]|uniref:4-hydroxythreonine-4-phosphate dehydrogenase n=1 Tax=Teichococcus deserti TaxID=1817963 RepID=A0A1V2GYC1_9PROT|nr:4-hydroxythreonine-4-phosphate dehydrogenase PdxA [Pseudoroseomonas deserti]ONG50144.1 4-hydroxythreonine-4-phosphate dehydrogenase [Pseudoroseomonas deserti]